MAIAKADAGGVPLPLAAIRKAAEDMRDRLVTIDKWSSAYANTLSQEPLLVGGRTSDKAYYIVEFRQDDSTTTGLMIVNALTGKVGQVAGIRRPTEALLVFYRPNQIPDLLHGRTELFDDSRRVMISRENVNVQSSLFWKPCDQSQTPFLPIYVVDHVKERVKDLLWVRVDGEVYTRITQSGRGL